MEAAGNYGSSLPSFSTSDASDPRVIQIAKCLFGFDFRGVPAFFDVGFLTAQPAIFQACIDLLYERYRNYKIDKVGGMDARGFLFGPPLALRLGVPFFMFRKTGKLPGPVLSHSYETEYSSDTFDMSATAVSEGDRILLVDDLMATGGTLLAAKKLVEKMGGVVVESAVVEVSRFFPHKWGGR